MLLLELSAELPTFLDSRKIQMAKGLPKSTIGFSDSNLLVKDFVCVKPLVEPLEKDKYLQVLL